MKMINHKRLDNLILSFKEVWKFDKRLIFVLLSNICITALLPFPNIIFSGKIVDSIISGNNFSLVICYIILLFGANYFLTIISQLLSTMKEYMFVKLINKLDNEVSQKCLNMDFEQFNESSMQDRILLVNQAIHGNNFFTSLTIFCSIISKLITLIGVLCVMSMLEIRLLVVALIIVIFQSALYYIKLKYNRSYQVDSANDRRKNAYVSNLTKDVRYKKDIVLFDMGNYIMKKIESFQTKMLELEKKRIHKGVYIEIAIHSLAVFFQVVAYLSLGISAFKGDISIGGFTMGITSLVNFMSASSFITNNIIAFNDNFFYIRQYKSFLKQKSKFDAKQTAITLDDMDLDHIEIEFRNVSFRYPNSTNFVLKNLNLKIKNSERLGIVGYNGAGKTTFTLLLMRMYDPTEGAIYVNGVDIREIDYKEYYKIISSVNQDFCLFAFSLLENISISDELTTDEKDYIIKCLNDNGLGDRLKKMYRGLNTPITKILSASGVDLSGGERQKLAIVRALYKNSPVLILDEPTSALDPIAEQKLFEKFAEMSEGRTTILISHRIYSTRFCDKIAVFENGEIKEYGTYDELMNLKGLYFDFIQQQAKYFL